MTIMQLAMGGKSRPHKKWYVETDRRIDRLMKQFEQSTINLDDCLDSVIWCVCRLIVCL